MKKNGIALVFLGVFILLPIAVAAQTEVKVTLPSFSGLVGLGPKTSISVIDATPFSVRLYALNQEVACFGPGGSIYERYGWEFGRSELPLLAFVYSDTHCRNLIGIAGKVLTVRRREPSDWTIRISDINYLDGSSRYYVDGVFFGYPETPVGKSRKVDFPKIELKSTTAIQFANATPYEATVYLNGRKQCFLASGEYCYCETWKMYSRSSWVKAKVVFSNNGAMVGYREDSFTVGGNEPRAHQLIFTTQKIRKY